MKIQRYRTIAASLAFAFLSSAQAQLTFTNVNLPPKGSGSFTTFADFSADGRWVAATSNLFYKQTSFNSDAFSSIGSFPIGLDPAFVKTSVDGNWAAVAAGGFNQSKSIFLINTTGGTATSMLSLSNAYDGVWRNNSELFVAAKNNTSDARVLLVNTNGSLSTVITNAGANAGGVALNSSGDLFVADGTFGGSDIRRFSHASLTNALASGSSLNFLAGAFVTNLGVSGSLAWDSDNHLLVTGYTNLFFRLDLDTYALETYNPANIALGSGGYNVIARGNLIGAYDGFTPSDLYVATIPEPSMIALLALGALAALGWKQKQS